MLRRDRKKFDRAEEINLYLFVLNQALSRYDALGLKTCETKLFFGHGGKEGEDSEQWQEVLTALSTIRRNSERYEQQMKGGRIGGGTPQNDNDGLFYGFGGCQPQVSNGAIPAAQRLFDGSLFNGLLNADGDLPLNGPSVTAAIDKMMEAARTNTENNVCKIACCTSIIVSLKCTGRPDFIVGDDSDTRMNASLADFDSKKRCGKKWEYSCGTKQWRSL